MSLHRIIVVDEKQLNVTIFTAVERLDLADTLAVIHYIKSAYDAIKQHGYKEGVGDRTLLKELILAEEKNGTILVRKKISQLQAALDIFELHETTLPLNEHEKIYFLVSVYNTVASGFLDTREAEVELDKLFHDNMDVCKLYSYDNIEYLKFFAQSVSRYASDIRLSTTATTDEKKHLLIDLARDMKILKVLIDKILSLESEYKIKKRGPLKAPKSKMLGKLEEAILICASEATKGNPEPEKWFFMLWEEVGDLAKKFVDSDAKKEGVLFSPKLADIINKTILNDRLLKYFAENYKKNASTPMKGEHPK